MSSSSTTARPIGRPSCSGPSPPSGRSGIRATWATGPACARHSGRPSSGGYDGLVTLDCDGQHEPSRIPELAAAAGAMPTSSRAAVISQVFDPSQRPPEQRRRINVEVTRWLNECLGLNVTDAFCGFKAYRTSALEAVRHHGRRLRHAASGLGAGRRPWADDRGGRGPADLPGRVAGLRRRARRCRITGWPTIAASSRRRSIAPDWSRRGGVWDDGTPPAGTCDRRRLAGRTRPGARSSASSRGQRRPAARPGITTSRAVRRTRLRAQVRREIVELAREFLRRHGLVDAGSNGPESPSCADRPAHRDRAPARAVPSGRLGQEFRGVGDRPLLRRAWP